MPASTPQDLSVGTRFPSPIGMQPDNVAPCVAGSPNSRPAAQSCLIPAHDPLHSLVVQGLEVSRGDVLQHQLLQAQLTHQLLQLGVLLLQFLQPSRLIYLQAAVLFSRAIVRLLGDSTLPARHLGRLAIRNRDLNLPQQAHHLLSVCFFPSL
jgi:hypothetical protein